MANIAPNALERAVNDGLLNEPQLRTFQTLCSHHRNTNYIGPDAYPADWRSFPVLIKCGLFEWRREPAREGYFFTSKGRKLKRCALQE